MRDFQEIFDLTMEHGRSRYQQTACTETFSHELCEFKDLNGRILAEDLKADRDLPPFNRVAMDGYACRRDDLSSPLTISGSIAAGSVPDLYVEPGTCIKVMTGAVLPKGADLVVMVESTAIDASGRMVFRGSDRERRTVNFSRQGEDVQAGQTVLKKGTILSARHAALLASIGMEKIPVIPLSKVGILSTGNEVIDPGSDPQPHQIRNANAPQLASLLERLRITPVNYGIIPDDLHSITEAVSRARDDNDLVLMSGGVSMGDYDLVPKAIESAGFRILYNRVAVKPGKPSTFAVSSGCDLFGLPGNPVSCFVIFEILVKPYLYSMMSASYKPPRIMAEMGVAFTRSKTAREEWIPVLIRDDGKLIPVTYHGSGHYNAIAQADGMILIEKGNSKIEKGTSVALRLIP
ncbi:MAG: molybdopterin molybdotransferase MoeA [Spirochaetota bacterium]|nr:molybdopterin molybdotransferase MoeA [Spirochaetota bacterium]